MRPLLIMPVLLFLLPNLVRAQAKTYDFPQPVDTHDKEIELQIKRVFPVNSSLFADNLFPGARLNSVSETEEGIIIAYVSPENSPINSSPWYAFRMWTSGATESRTVRVTYPENYKHRYWPKISLDGKNWIPSDSSRVFVAPDTSFVEVILDIPPDTVWLSAQPIVSSQDVADWGRSLRPLVKYGKAGKSRGGREIPYLLISNGSVKGKEIIVCLSRQHPPEVTGYFALQGFIERILERTELGSEFLQKYVVMVYPLLNPDGVDNGHWRHNLGGVDLNRDWAYYRQQETRTVADHIVKNVKRMKGRVALGLDFHSTWYDVYYTMERDIDVINADFSDRWLAYLKKEIPGYDPHDDPAGIATPVSKGWFVTQFNANGITYEIGDTTPGEFILLKSRTAADGMMRILLEKND